MKKALIMGANGYIGSNLTRYLCNIEGKYEIVASSRNNTNIDSRANYIQYDILSKYINQNEFVEYFGVPDICIYLAWQDGFIHNSDSHLKCLPYHWNFIKTALDSGVKHLVVFGTSREYGNFHGAADEERTINPDNFYILAKDSLHKAIQIYLDNDKNNVCFQWIRPFSVLGDDENSHSIFNKILQWEREGRRSFPCTDGTERYDYIHIDELVKQIEQIISQTEVSGTINCCSGFTTSLKEQVEKFISENKLSIRPEYGTFSKRAYDSDELYGNKNKLNRALYGENSEINTL